MPLTKIRAAGIADDRSQTQAGSIHIGTSFSSANKMHIFGKRAGHLGDPLPREKFFRQDIFVSR